MLRNCLNHRYSLVPSTPIESDIQIKKPPLQNPCLQGFSRGLFWILR